jgi:hypothetical protein
MLMADHGLKTGMLMTIQLGTMPNLRYNSATNDPGDSEHTLDHNQWHG